MADVCVINKFPPENGSIFLTSPYARVNQAPTRDARENLLPVLAHLFFRDLRSMTGRTEFGLLFRSEAISQ